MASHSKIKSWSSNHGTGNKTFRSSNDLSKSNAEEITNNELEQTSTTQGNISDFVSKFDPNDFWRDGIAMSVNFLNIILN